MSELSRICLIGFGEVGQILAEDLAKAGAGDIAVYDILFDKPDSIPSTALATHKVRAAPSAAEAAKDADLILCAVTAEADIAAAHAVVTGIARGAFYVDFNSASPGSKIEAGAIIEHAGGRYVEAAVMTPIGPKRIASSMLLGGRHAEEFCKLSKPLGFCGEMFSQELGRASATKMCRSVIVKGIEALLAESLLTARRYGVEHVVLELAVRPAARRRLGEACRLHDLALARTWRAPRRGDARGGEDRARGGHRALDEHGDRRPRGIRCGPQGRAQGS